MHLTQFLNIQLPTTSRSLSHCEREVQKTSCGIGEFSSTVSLARFNPLDPDWALKSRHLESHCEPRELSTTTTYDK